MARQPGEHLGMLVGRVVVEDHVDHLARRNLALDGVQEADELLVPVALHAAADHGPVEDVERREQGRGAVALVGVGERPSLAGLERQPRLGPVEGLDLMGWMAPSRHAVSSWEPSESPSRSHPP